MNTAVNFSCSLWYEVKDCFGSHNSYSAAIVFVTMNSDSKPV